MKKHETTEENFYYVTVDMAMQKNIGRVKPGTSQQKKVTSRINSIRSEEPGMHLMGYLTIYNTNKSRIEAMEHEIKADMVDAGFEHYGNDHFQFNFNRTGNRYIQYTIISLGIILKAMRYCRTHNLAYDLTWVG